MPEPITLFAQLRFTHGLTWQQLQKRVEDAGLTVSQRQLQRLANGENQPGADLAEALQLAFGLPVDQLLAPYTGQPLPSLRGATATTPREVLALATDDAHRFRIGIQRPDTTGLTEEVRTLAHEYPREPLPTILTRLVNAQQTIRGHFARGTIHTASARELHLLDAITTGLLAKAAHDLGDSARAADLARSADSFAELAGHPLLRAWVAGLQSLFAYWGGRPQESVRDANRAMHLAGDSPTTVTVWAAASAARAWGKMGKRDEVLRAMALAEAAAQRVTAGELEAFGGPYDFADGRRLYYMTEASVNVGLLDEAERFGTQAAAAYSNPQAEHWSFGDAGGAAAALAMSRVGQGEIAGAQEALATVLALTPEQRIHGVVECVKPVCDALTKTGSRVGLELGAKIEDFMSTPLRAAP